MFNQSNLSAHPGSKKAPKRIGRGNGSGNGTYCGRGVKGQGSRTGKGKFNAAFEGGQTPLFRRLPKMRGFTAYNPAEFAIVNVEALAKLAAAGTTAIDAIVLHEKGLVRKSGLALKILGNGNIDVAISVKANKISAEAKAKIEKAGGTVELV
jgi:large subunit ribosomal protein L15